MNKGTISVIIPCHNYGRYLSRCLQSVLGQTRRPDEIIVVDDSSEEPIEEIVQKFHLHHVRYIRVDHRNPLLTRRSGLREVSGEYLCFLDADDTIAPDYIEKGMKVFDQDHRIGIVYSDVEFQGVQSGLSNYPADSDSQDISIQNYIHSGALVRHSALTISDAFNHGGPIDRHEDWSVWRKVIEAGFRAVKQDSRYYYNKHLGGLSAERHYGQNGYTYFRGAALADERISLVVPLSGRTKIWPRFREFLQNQTWNHRRVQLVLLDTSVDPDFGKLVKQWIAECDYTDVRYVQFRVGKRGLADAPRVDEHGGTQHDVLAAVRLTMAKIYNRLRATADANYIWIVEDDVIPPNDAAERMMRSFCQNTLSVSGVVPHRYEDGAIAWSGPIEMGLLKDGSGVQQIDGNGFGCVIIRGSAFRDMVFSDSATHPDFDRDFYCRKNPDQIVKLDWDVRCEHLSPKFDRNPQLKTNIIIDQENFDELYYLLVNPDVGEAIEQGYFESGWKHYEKYGQKESRAARALSGRLNQATVGAPTVLK